MSLREAVPISIGKPCLSIADHSPHLNPPKLPRGQRANAQCENRRREWRMERGDREGKIEQNLCSTYLT